MMRLLYSFVINLYGLAVYLAAPFNKKAGEWLSGRKNWKKKLREAFKDNPTEVYWFHVSSLGEFEQARPVIEFLKNRKPEIKILLTFFSPSGFTVRKNYELATWVFYLPLDTKSNAYFFIQTVKPRVAVFVKYDFWYNYLSACYQNKIPTVYFSVLMRSNHYLNRWYSVWFIGILKGVNMFFVQDDFTLEWFKRKGISTVQLSGDTRFDRVLQIVKQRKPLPEIENLFAGKRVLVAGSTWPADERLIAETMLQEDFKEIALIVAPHDISYKRLKEVEKTFAEFNPIFYSKLNAANNSAARCLIIDNIGLLSSLYFYAYLCYVGGGFGKTVHNTQEPAAYGKPVFFGPNFSMFKEAVELVKTKGGFSVQNKGEFGNKLNELMHNPVLYSECALAAANVVKNGAGKTEPIAEYLMRL